MTNIEWQRENLEREEYRQSCDRTIRIQTHMRIEDEIMSYKEIKYQLTIICAYSKSI